MALIDNTVAYYKLDTDNGTQPDEVASNDGTVVGATFTASGKINGGYSLDGSNDRIDFSNWISSYPFSINIWIKKSVDDVFGTIASIGDVSATNIYDYINVNAANFPECVSRNTTSRVATSATDVSGGGWHMITGVWASTTSRKIYVDGANPVENTGSSNFNGNIDCGRFGALCNAAAQLPFPGVLDEAGIWDKALSQAEITELYNGGAGLAYPFSAPTPDLNNAIFHSMNF